MRFCTKIEIKAQVNVKMKAVLPERVMATFWIPPSPFKLFLALGPKNSSRKFAPWLWSRDCRKLEVSSTGGLLAFTLKV